ncbi:MAG: TAT-variant-translocated molybdopterin oxidoreductase [Bacteroidia bacterium]|nr:TAT-variant-translocated molybdopterin oxidoreductase [Bacteroidia bacterium]MCZ2277900.1 TAT-variant-translocated molybdopterin oxidoreductase [Bacteroidia bacterium]
MEKQYWKGLEELNNDPEFVRLKNNEFYELLPVKESDHKPETTRRDFLKYMGFGIAAASLAACEAPVKKAIPYLIKPEEITPGVPNYYASTFFDGYDYASILVKTREGRPIKVEGNELSSVNNTGTNARTQASILGLYDEGRIQNPLIKEKVSDWKTIDAEVTSKLTEIAAKQGNIRILSSTIISPSTKKVIADFTTKFPTTKHIQYDAISHFGMIKANKLTFGKAALPNYSFDKANCIVGFECDFIGNWISPVQYARQYAQTRKISSDKKNMSQHIQFESNLSLTGSNADIRYKIQVNEHGAALVALYNILASKAGAASLGTASTSVDQAIAKTAESLWGSRGKSLVVSGSNDVNHQVIVNGINQLLGNYGSTIDLSRQSNLRQGNDEEMNELMTELKEGKVAALIIYNSNPVYTLADGEAFAAALGKVELSVAIGTHKDETASRCQYLCPDHHYLESWNDAEPIAGHYSSCQPTIRPLYNTRQGQTSLLIWAGNATSDFHDYMQVNWSNLLSGSSKTWQNFIQDGVFEAPATAESVSFNDSELINAAIASLVKKQGAGLVLYEMTAMGNGIQANNPWLLELPDPITRLTWDNFFAVSIAYAKQQGLVQGNIIEVKSGNKTIKGPVLIQPGLANNTIAVSYGFGRTQAGKAGNGIGINSYPFAIFSEGTFQNLISGVEISKTIEDNYSFAGVQTHHTLMGRNHDILKETTLTEWIKDPASGNTYEEITTYQGKVRAAQADLWATPKQPGHDKPNHLWGMVIDLNACIGCGACVVACTAENNVPVVGKDEISRSREMHWMRIDRYYSSDADPKTNHDKKDYAAMEIPSDSPQVLFQPMMCQHCNHAPCETVCPVAATTHSSEGLNMMAYNRCVGTRYCENNCPYKVRRFNWFKYFDNDQFDYNMNNPVGKLQLNPDVIVRSRGVMEKCSLCVQRIQAGKLQAKKEGRPVEDGEIKTACAQACPTNAIVFGDYLNSESQASRMKDDPRSYVVLEHLNTQPNVYYQVKVRNV